MSTMRTMTTTNPSDSTAQAVEAQVDRRVLLSSLWVFVLFNIFFADFHALVTPGTLEEIMSGIAGGFRVNERLLLFAALFHEIPVVMVLLSRVLARRGNRWANMAAAALYLFTNVTGGPTDLDHLFFRAVICAGLLLIIWLAWTWPKPADREAHQILRTA